MATDTRPHIDRPRSAAALAATTSPLTSDTLRPVTIALTQISLVLAAAALAFAATRSHQPGDAHVERLAFEAATLAGVTAGAGLAALVRFVVAAPSLEWERRLTGIAIGGLSLNLLLALMIGVRAVFGLLLAYVILTILAVLLFVVVAAMWRHSLRSRNPRRWVLRAASLTVAVGFYVVAWLAAERKDNAMFIASLAVLLVGLISVAAEALSPPALAHTSNEL